MNTYLQITSALNCAGTVVLGVSVLVAGRRNPRNFLFALFLFCIAVWSAFYFLWRISDDEQWATLFCQALMGAAVFLPVTLLHFIERLTGSGRSGVVVAGYLSAALLLGANAAGLIVSHVEYTVNYGFWPMAGALFPAALVSFGGFTVYSWWLLWRKARTGDSAEHRQLRYILGALVVGFIGGATNFPLWYGIPIPPVGNGVVLVYTAMMAHAILKYRLPQVSIDLAKGFVYSCLALTLATFYVVLYAIVAYFTGTLVDAGTLIWQFAAALVVCGIFLWLAPRLKVEADRLMEQTLFKGRYLHRRQLRELAARIFNISDEQRVFTESADVIARALQVEHLAVYFRGEMQAGYLLRAAHGYGRREPVPESLPDDNPLAVMLQVQNETVIYQEGDRAPGYDSADVARLRDRFKFEAVVPIHGSQTLLGFLLLGHPQRDGFFEELDLSLVETICLQIGLAVRSRQLERRANQTEKLISLGTLAAGLAHELRNPLVSIRTFSALLKENGGDPEFQQEFRQIMERDIARITAIVENVSAFAERHEVELAPLELRAVLKSVEEITADERRSGRVALEWPRDRATKVVGNYGQLVQVFINLVQNATHALDGREAARIEVTWREEQSGGGRWLRIELRDNGRGIDAAMLPRIFDPFVTTKATGNGSSRRGMGLGLAIVKRIIDGHHGQIGVDSRVGEGTRFTVLLPVPELAA